jgi:hypothetical protein
MESTDSMTANLIADRSAAELGAAWLDTHYPDWTDRFDGDELNMQNASQCVAAQVVPAEDGAQDFSGYWRVTREHSTVWAQAHGFCLLSANEHENWIDRDTRWAALADVWRELAAARRDE